MKLEYILVILVFITGFGYVETFVAGILGYRKQFTGKYPTWLNEGLHALVGIGFALSVLGLSQYLPIHPTFLLLVAGIGIWSTIKLLIAISLLMRRA